MGAKISMNVESKRHVALDRHAEMSGEILLACAREATHEIVKATVLIAMNVQWDIVVKDRSASTKLDHTNAIAHQVQRKSGDFVVISTNACTSHAQTINTASTQEAATDASARRGMKKAAMAHVKTLTSVKQMHAERLVKDARMRSDHMTVSVRMAIKKTR